MRWPYILSLISLLGAGLLLFFNILCGASTSSVLGRWYWLEAGTESIPGANSVTRWTNYNSCGVNNGRNVDCSSSSAAYPMSPASNFGTTEGVPSGLQDRHGVTYYLSKTGWAFLLIGLFFTVIAIVPVIVSFCLANSILGVITAIGTGVALLFTTLAASLLTAAYVKARNDFRNAGSTTSLGSTMFGFIWASFVLLLISSLLSGVGCFGNRSKKRQRNSENYDSSSHDTYGNNYVQEKNQQRTRGGFFGRRNKPENDVENPTSGTYDGEGFTTTGQRTDYPRTTNNEPLNRSMNSGENAGSVGGNKARNVATGAVVGSGVAAAATIHSSAFDSKDNRNSKTGTQTPLGNETSKAPSTGVVPIAGYSSTSGDGSKVEGTDKNILTDKSVGQDVKTESVSTPENGKFDQQYDYNKDSELNVDALNREIYEDPNNEPKGIWASAAAALGFGGAAGSGVDAENLEGVKDTTHENTLESSEKVKGTTYGKTLQDSERLQDSQVTHGINLDDDGKYVNRDEYGNETIGYKTGVPKNAAGNAAYVATEKTGGDSSSKQASGFQPTEYYSKNIQQGIPNNSTKDRTLDPAKERKGTEVSSGAIPKPSGLLNSDLKQIPSKEKGSDVKYQSQSEVFQDSSEAGIADDSNYTKKAVSSQTSKNIPSSNLPFNDDSKLQSKNLQSKNLETDFTKNQQQSKPINLASQSEDDYVPGAFNEPGSPIKSQNRGGFEQKNYVSDTKDAYDQKFLNSSDPFSRTPRTERVEGKDLRQTSEADHQKTFVETVIDATKSVL